METNPRFKVERHSDTEWRIVGTRIGDGFVVKDEALAAKTCARMNTAYGEISAGALSSRDQD